MGRRISEYTIDQVKQVPILDVAIALGHSVKRKGTSFELFCPNPGHIEKTPDCHINPGRGNVGIFKCFGGGGCGCQGNDAIKYYSWSMFSGYNPKEHFIESVKGVAELMGISIVYEDGGEYTGERTRRPVTVAKTFATQHIEVEARDADTCDRIYRKFLDLCPIYAEHATEWLGPERQYTQEQVLKLGLRSVPKTHQELFAIIRKLLDSGESLERIPGFTKRLKKDGDPSNLKDWYWTLATGNKGYFIPVRDEFGRISRLRVRTFGKPKYIWFSSSPNVVLKNEEMQFLDPTLDPKTDGQRLRLGGAPSGAPLNVVVPFKLHEYWTAGTSIDHLCDMSEVIGTEGEHKSNIAANILKKPVLGIPGVGNYKDVIPLLKKWGTQTFILAYDMDGLKKETDVNGKNQEVFNHIIEFAKQLLEAGIEVKVWTWDIKDGKGLDDLLLNKKLPLEIDLRTKQTRTVQLAS